jgi:hypothetical protein
MSRLSLIFHYLFWTTLAAGAAVAAGEFLINKIYFGESEIFSGGWIAMLGNILILCCILLLFLALTNRQVSAILIGLSFYGFLVFFDILKLIYFDNPLQPTDLQYWADLRAVAKSFLEPQILLTILAAFASVVALSIVFWRKKFPALSPAHRIGIGAVAAVLLVSFFILPSSSTAREWLNERGIELPESWQFEPRVSARLNGLLVEWAMGAVDWTLHRPEQYTRPGAERIARAYERMPDSNGDSASQQPINLIIYLMESFMDPLDLGVRFTSDPIPVFHAISRKSSSGKVVAPVFAGTSANTEFELLTGLSMYFLPNSSCPYRQYVTQDIPSLPRFLHQHGYRSAAILADPPYLFNRKAVFSHFGFDRWTFLPADRNIPLSANDEFATDEAVADATIAASRGSNPFFILAFTGGTHFPWDYPDYKDSPLDIVGPMQEPNRSQLKTYINALRVADQSLKKLITHFENTDQRTAILIMGDHLPPLGGIYNATGFFNSTGLEQIRKRYQVPAVLWCNWPTAKKDFICSTNFIAARLSQFIGLCPTGIFALDADVHLRFQVLSNFVETADGRVFYPQASGMPFQQLIEDYRLIQYDLLMGNQYALEFPGWGWK